MVPVLEMSELRLRELTDLPIGSLSKYRVGIHPLIQGKKKKNQLPVVC